MNLIRTRSKKRKKERENMAMMKIISIKSIYLLLLVGFVGAQDGIFDIVAKYGAKPDGEISQVKTKQ